MPFLPKSAHTHESVPQGGNSWINWPGEGLFGARATIKPGTGHDFHYHPGREELIYVLEGQVEQWIGEEKQVLEPGDAVVIPADVVHASFNMGAGEAVIFVVLTEAQGEQPLGVDVAQDVPWRSLRG
ncbi:MAG: cupin domain-containing protein [Bacteroidota bacterium]